MNRIPYLPTFFCDDKDERARNSRSILADLVAQLLRQAPHLLLYFREELKAEVSEKTVWTFGMLWRVFTSVI